LTDPAFLAKNQLSEKGSGIIVIPALPNSGPTNICPVRTLLKYLDKISVKEAELKILQDEAIALTS
jgi:hypothetical protein